MQKEGRIFWIRQADIRNPLRYLPDSVKLIFKLPRCHARRFFELAGEVGNVLETAGDGNIADAHLALCEKLLGARNPAIDDVV